MRPILNTLTFIILLALSFRISAQKPTTAPEPSWVTHAPDNPLDPKLLTTAEDGYINQILENQVHLASHTTYHRVVLRMLTEEGVQNSSTVDAEYDPSYERLIWHKIQIIRDGKVINKLNLSKMKNARQEEELNRSVYNGTVKSFIFLEDVRKGDLIEYAYSVQGSNPIFSGKYSTTVNVQFARPLGHMLYRLICPSGRGLVIKPYLTKADPVVTTRGADKVYQWELDNIFPLDPEDDEPSWFNPFPSIGISEFATWAEVNKWALSLFAPRTVLSAGLTHKIAEIEKKAGGDEEKKVLGALRFVQDDVRYLGIELGENSHKPHDPNSIFSQRFGDCKDKSFLLCTMLRTMHIDAAPVLINTSDKQELHRLLPSPLDFDHCTVRVRLGNKIYWFDPTIAFQRGSIKDISYPNYKCGLVLMDTTTCLTDIPLQESGQIVAKEKFNLPDTYGAAKMEVITTYTGSYADRIRRKVNSSSLSAIEKDFLDFYNDFYEGMKISDSLRVQDDETTGKITTYEFYIIDKIWTQQKGVKKASFDALLISSILNKPDEEQRTTPVRLVYPARYTEEIEIRVPQDWNLRQDPMEIKSPCFNYSYSVNATERGVNLIYSYEALQDHVTAPQLTEYLRNYDRLNSVLGYSLTNNVDAGSSSGGGSNSGTRGILDGLSDKVKLAIALMSIGILATIYVKRR
jgi:hypothetical protein